MPNKRELLDHTSGTSAGEVAHDDDDGIVLPPGNGAVQLSLHLSALRCILTYVVLPAAGLTGAWASVRLPIDLALSAAAIASSTYGARTLWRVRSRARVPYTVLAVFVCAMAGISILRHLVSFVS